MEWRELGVTGLELPVIGLRAAGAFDVIGKESQAARRNLVTRALENGIALFDTSPAFGEAEHVLGAALTGRRNQAIVSTCIRATGLRQGHDQIERALYYFENRVDIYQVAAVERWRQFLSALRYMKRDGTINATGLSNLQPSMFSAVAELVASRQVDSIQIPYDPLLPEASRQLLQLARERGVGVIVTQPFHGGPLLDGGPPRAALRPFNAFGVETWPQAVLKWILSDDRVTAVVPETRQPEVLTEFARAGEPPWFGSRERREVERLARRYATASRETSPHCS